MAILSDYHYYAPSTLGEVLDLLSSYKSPAVLSGGSDLIVNLKSGRVEHDAIIDIKQLQKSELALLKKLECKGETLFIGSLVTFSEIINSKIVQKRAPLLVEMAKTVASVGVRNRASMVGNICSAVPCMDSAPVLLVYDALVHTKSIDDERTLAIQKFFISPRKTLLRKKDLVMGISLALPKGKLGSRFVKLMRYRGEDLAQANLAILALSANHEYRVAFGSLSGTPLRATAIEKVLRGEATLTEELLTKVKNILPTLISPITDIRASKEYRLHMAKVMLERGLLDAALRREGSGSHLGENLI
ncbi:MAG: FAD binding domain-containing protein [Oligoflexia bacterium]|nr:FAD binding domain-containing protein [Oligoflexia bacterium]MBF0365660.1 FAD binding domain-containing protein [Oligoflexia bacterium]